MLTETNAALSAHPACPYLESELHTDPHHCLLVHFQKLIAQGVSPQHFVKPEGLGHAGGEEQACCILRHSGLFFILLLSRESATASLLLFSPAAL